MTAKLFYYLFPTHLSLTANNFHLVAPPTEHVSSELRKLCFLILSTNLSQKWTSATVKLADTGGVRSKNKLAEIS